MEVVNQWLGAVAFLVSIVNVVAVWVMRPGKIAKERHDGLKEHVDRTFDAIEKIMLENFKSHDRRIQAVESDQRHMPTKDDFHKLSEKFTALEAKVSTEMKGLGTTVRRIDDYLRDQGK